MTKTKKLLALLLAVVMVLGLLPALHLGMEAVADETPAVTLDFTTNDWGLPNYSHNKVKDEDSYKSGDYTIKVAGSTSGGGYYYDNTPAGKYLLFGKSGAYITLPDFDFDVDRIVFTGKNGASSETKMNVYVGNTAVSTETTGSAGTNTYVIHTDYQEKGNVYTLKITSAHNAQVTKIEVYKKASDTTYTVTYEPNGGTGSMPNTAPTKTTGSLTLPACCFTAPEGKSFAGWLVSTDHQVYAAGDMITGITENVTLTAQWEDTATYTKITSFEGLSSGGKYLLVAAPRGKAFDGNSNDSGNSVAVTITTNTSTHVDEIVGNYAANEVTISALAGGYSLKNARGKYISNKTNAADVVFGNTAVSHTIAFEEQYGTAWIKDSKTLKYLSYNPSNFIRYYDNSYEKVSLFKKVGRVSFNANGGTGTMEPVTMDENAVYTVPANGFTREGYQFTGWKVGDTGELLKAGVDTITITGNVVLYAQWEENPVSTTKTYYLVTSADQLKDGDKIIMVGLHDEDAYALTNQRSENRGAVQVTVNANTITLTAASDADYVTAAHELTLGKVIDGDNVYWTFKDVLNDGYLYAAASDSNRLKTETTLDEDGNAEFTLNIGDDGLVKPEASKSANRNNIRFNWDSTNSSFSCYPNTSGLPGVYIYKELNDGYYLLNGNNWTVDEIDLADKFEENPGAEGEYMLGTTLAVGDQIKVVKVENGAITGRWPNGVDTQYHVDAAHAGAVNIYFKTDYVNDWSAFGGYFYIKARDLFKTQNLVLSELIGVQFFLDLSVLTPEQNAGSYMTFTISGRGANDLKTTRVDYADASTNSKGYRGFLCKVNVLQMADTITATFHYGDSLTATKDYSVKDYVDKWAVQYHNGQTGLTGDKLTKTNELIKALADYGHYVQPFLAGVHNFELCDKDHPDDSKYMQMDVFYATDFDTSGIYDTENNPKYPMTASTNPTSGSVFGNPTMALKLDSETAIRVYFKPQENVTFGEGFTVTVTKEGETTPLTLGEDYTVTKTGNRYMVEITGVKASELLTKYTIEATNGNTADAETQTVCLFAASYVGRLLSSEAYKENDLAKAAVCALWNYAQAAANYND